MSLTAAEREAIVRRGLEDPRWFCEFFLSHWFPTAMPWFHRAILAIVLRTTDFLIDDPDLPLIVQHFVYLSDPQDPESEELPIFEVDRDDSGRPTAVHLIVSKYTLDIMPRGYSKTTLFNAICIIFICYRLMRFGVYISEASPHAEMQLGNVKRELETNALLIEVFGEFIGPVWREDFIETSTGVVLAARGSGAQIRGLNYKANRPDKLFIDDVQTKETVRGATQRENDHIWLYSDVLPALPDFEQDLTGIAPAVFMLGTLLHRDCLVARVALDARFTTIRLSELDRNGNPLWPEKRGMATIEADRKSAILIGRLAEYYLEYRNEIRSVETQLFPGPFLYRATTRDKLLAVAIALDPAISKRARACAAAIGVVGVAFDGYSHVLEVWSKQGAEVSEMVDEYFRLSRAWAATRHGVETVGFQASLIATFREKMGKTGYYFDIEKITHSSEKDARITGVLQPRYASGFMVHQRRFQDYETDLMDWQPGDASPKDRPDAVAMAFKLLTPYLASIHAAEHDPAASSYPPLEEMIPDMEVI